MITFYLEADTADELRRQAVKALGIGPEHIGRLTVPGNYPDVRPYEGNSATQDYNLTPGVVTRAPPERDPVPEAESKPRRKHRATRPPVATPVPIEELFEEEEELGGGGDDVGALRGLAPVSTPVMDRLVDEKIKAEVIGRLADLFTAGKVKVLRALLDQYGDGAKSFPEIDAAKFPAIREALDKGIAA